jgi:glucose-6-phosphate 1-dehydrogenase
MSFDLVLFGGTGDLAWRKLMPALFQAFRHGTLPDGGRIIGVGRDDLSADQYRELIRSRFDQVDLDKRPSMEEFTRFAALLDFVRMDLSQTADYAHLAQTLNQRQTDTVVMYVATAPSLFTMRATGGGRAQYCQNPRGARKTTRPRPRLQPRHQRHGAPGVWRETGISH